MDREAQRELLVRLLRGRPGEVRPAELEGLSHADWEGVLQESVAHMVTPLLYQAVKALEAPANVPEGVVERLRGAYLHNAARNTLIYRELSRALNALRDRGVPVVVLKGAHLAEVVYGNVAVRPMADLDLLVREGDLDAADEALSRAGLHMFTHVRRAKHYYQQRHFHFAYTGRAGITVEVHWSLSREFEIRIDDMWARARPARTAAAEALVLCPEDLLLHLCMHAAFPEMYAKGIRPLCDIARTVQYYQDQIDWAEFQRTASENELATCSYYSLVLAATVLGAEVPQPVLERLRPRAAEPGFLKMIERRLWLPKSPPAVNVAGTPWRMLTTRGLRGKMLAFLHALFPPVEEIRRWYVLEPTSKKAYLYYPRHLLDMVRRRAKGMLHLAMKTAAARESLDRQRAEEAIREALKPQR